jgi:hypothetical protein
MASTNGVDMPPRDRQIVLVASGDARLAANQAGWPAQLRLERALDDVARANGIVITRGHGFTEGAGHGFIDSQRRGMDVFAAIDPDAAVIVATAIWQFSHHVLAGLLHHRGPVLTVANWSGEWPGLVGLLNLNASLAKAGRAYSTLWSETFDDETFLDGFTSWLDTGMVEHDTSHVTGFDRGAASSSSVALGRRLAGELLDRKAIIGVFDEGCMGMYNAILEDRLINRAGIFKERLSQSALLAEMGAVSGAEAAAARQWLDDRGLQFVTGRNESEHLTDTQIIGQLKMYIAAGRIAHRFGCDAIGIQYQLGLADMVPASDLAEGLLNNADRPPITVPGSGEVIADGSPIPHFNEADEGVAVDLVVTSRVWKALGLDPAATLHDVRWGETYDLGSGPEFVWTFMISGSIPASHVEGGYAGAKSERQPSAYFRLGGGTLSGVSRPGPIVWSRVYQLEDELHVDLGRGNAVALPREETDRRLALTTPEWPIMHAVLHGVTRDQFMARHKSNHVTVAYGADDATADEALTVKAAMFQAMGLTVHVCGLAATDA